MATWTIAKKEWRLLVRDPRAAIILLLMPFIFILVLGLSLGEGFGHAYDGRLGDGIDALPRPRHFGIDRGDVDDAAATRFRHQLRAQLLQRKAHFPFLVLQKLFQKSL